MAQATLYSAEDVAGMLGLHVRTVRNYVRDGRLPAVRIGKQYRIAEQDLREFTGDRSPQPQAPTSPRIEVSAVVQIDHVGRPTADRVTTHVMAAATSGSGDRPPLHVQALYDQDREALKIVALGDADHTAKVITLISALIEDADQ